MECSYFFSSPTPNIEILLQKYDTTLQRKSKQFEQEKKKKSGRLWSLGCSEGKVCSSTNSSSSSRCRQPGVKRRQMWPELMLSHTHKSHGLSQKPDVEFVQFWWFRIEKKSHDSQMTDQLFPHRLATKNPHTNNTTRKYIYFQHRTPSGG